MLGISSQHFVPTKLDYDIFRINGRIACLKDFYSLLILPCSTFSSAGEAVVNSSI